jgi:hypothetical protein
MGGNGFAEPAQALEGEAGLCDDAWRLVVSGQGVVMQ